MTFSFSNGWAAVDSAPSPITILNGTALTLVVTPSLAGLGYALVVGGTEGGPTVAGSVDL
jgi:hypothetical protein